MFNLILAILPTIIIIAFILWFDRYKREPLSLLIKLFIVGCLSVIPAIFLENFLPNTIYISTMMGVLVYSVLGIGLIEEGVKYVVTLIVAYKDKAFDEIYDGIIYCVLVSLGFATVENIMYVLAYGTSTALLRAVTAVPAHTIFAITMGYYLGLSKAYPKQKVYYQILAIVSPIILHGLYDFILFMAFDWGMLIFGIYGYYLYKRAFRLIGLTYDIPPFR
ncbi:MAG: PrsW family glutamic-type intramembrane protease [Erysipelotrichaceae bacterium]|nr:PrsW family glutamic-type intramembrane protease [Erysipelotrichaceae bacterium]